MALTPDLLAAPGNGVIGIAPVVCMPGAPDALAAAVDETFAAAGVVERVVAGRAALLDETLTGTGLMTTVDGTEATTVVAASVGPMMTTEGSGVVVVVVVLLLLLLLRWRVTVMWVVKVENETVVS